MTVCTLYIRMYVWFWPILTFYEVRVIYQSFRQSKPCLPLRTARAAGKHVVACMQAHCVCV